MNKENLKQLVYKYLPIALVAINALTIVLFLIGFASNNSSSVNIISIFSHLGGLNSVHEFSLPYAGRLFAISLVFIGVLVALITLAVFTVFVLRTCIQTQVVDFKLEYILRIKKLYVISLLITACYVAFATFLGETSINFLAYIVFVLAIVVLSACKFVVYFFGKEDLSLNDAIVKAARTLIYNVCFFGLGLVLLMPAIQMISEGYSHISWLLPSEKTFEAFYVHNLFFNLFIGVFCIGFFAVTMILFVMHNTIDFQKKTYRQRTKLAFVFGILILAIILVFGALAVVLATTSVKLESVLLVDLLRSLFIPCLLFFVAHFVYIAIDYKKVKDEE